MHSQTPFVLALEPDHRQASVLKRVIRERVHAELVVVDSRDAAIAATSSRVPDVILLTALLSPRDEQELIAHLRGLAGAEHVQTHTIPQLASSPQDADGGQEGGGLFGKLRRKKSAEPIPGCDPHAFADEVSTFLEHAAEKKAHAALMPPPIIEQPRRDDAAPHGYGDGPGAAAAHAGDGTSDEPAPAAESAWSSPFEWRRSDATSQKKKDTARKTPLVTNAPLAVVAEEEEARRADAERRARDEAASAQERERLDAERRAREEAERHAKQEAERIERERIETERRAKEEARQRAKEEEERRAKEEAERRAKEEAARRAKEEAERRAKEEAARRAKEEAERRAKEEAARRAKEEAERRAKEEAARRAKEEAERRAKEEAARRAKEEAERRAKEEAARRAKEEAERRAKEEAARRAKEEAERRAKEEAERIAREVAARLERERLEAEAAAQRERERLEAEAAEQERLRIEAAERARRETQEDEEIEIDLDHDPFSDFRPDEERESTLLKLMPVAAWARPDGARRQQTAEPSPRDEFQELMAGLSIPAHVAGVAYARGCRIRRVRVPAPRAAARGRIAQPLILSKRALQEARNDQHSGT